MRSACSHHFCPVIGKIWIGVMPNEHTNVIGLSKYARLVDWIMGPPDPGRAVVQLADLIMERPSPTAWPSSWSQPLLHVLARRARQRQPMINSVMRGVFLTAPCAVNFVPDSGRN